MAARVSAKKATTSSTGGGGSADVERRAVDAGVGRAGGELGRDDAGVGDDLHAELGLDARHVAEMAEQRHAPGPGRPARDEEPFAALGLEPGGEVEEVLPRLDRD